MKRSTPKIPDEPARQGQASLEGLTCSPLLAASQTLSKGKPNRIRKASFSPDFRTGNTMASGIDKALHAAELVTAREPLNSPALGTMAAFHGVPAPQTTDNALLSTDAHLLETHHDTSTFSEDHSPVVHLGDAEIEKSQLPSDKDWPPADKRSISYFKLYRLAWEHALFLVKSCASLLFDMSLMQHLVLLTDTAMDGII